MQNLFSFIPPTPAGAPLGSATPGGLTQMVTPQNNKNGHVGRAASNKALQSLLFMIGGLILLFGVGYFSEKKWGFLTRTKLKLVGARGLSGLKQAAEEFRNELYHWEKIQNPALNLDTYTSEVAKANQTFQDDFLASFSLGASDVKDDYKRKQLLKDYIAAYGQAADLSLLRGCALVVEKMKVFMTKLGYDKFQTIDTHDWKDLFDIEMEPFIKFAKKYISKNKGTEKAKEAKFYMERLDKLQALREKYMIMNGAALDWLKGKHPAIGKHHPDGKFLEIDEDEEESKKKNKKDNKKSEEQ